MEDFILKKLDVSNAPRRFRTIKLTKPAKNKKPDKKMNQYLVEAFLCYASGMFKACVALCRTAMEIGIRDQLNEAILVKYVGKNCDELIQEEKKHFREGNIRKEKKIWELIDNLNSLLGFKGISENRRNELKKLAHCIRIKGNIIVHSQENIETMDREKETQDVLLRTRNLLAEIYSIM
jgi:hypothetical protein